MQRHAAFADKSSVAQHGLRTQQKGERRSPLQKNGRRNSEYVGEHAARTAKRLGKDIVTDSPLLEE